MVSTNFILRKRVKAGDIKAVVFLHGRELSLLLVFSFLFFLNFFSFSSFQGRKGINKESIAIEGGMNYRSNLLFFHGLPPMMSPDVRTVYETLTKCKLILCPLASFSRSLVFMHGAIPVTCQDGLCTLHYISHQGGG